MWAPLFVFKSALLVNYIFNDVPIGVTMSNPPTKFALFVTMIVIEGNGFLACVKFFGAVIAPIVRFLLGSTLVPKNFKSRFFHL